MAEEENIEEVSDEEKKRMNPEDKSYGTEKSGSDRNSQQNRSILTKILQIQAGSSHKDIVETFVSYIFGTISGVIALLIANAIQLLMIIIGSVYINDCPNSRGIPIILIINGSINLLLCIIESVKRNINSNSDIITKFKLLIITLKLASTVGFFAWIVLVYDSESPNYDDLNAKNYCNQYLYLFAFWLLNSLIAIILFLIFIACCCCCISS